MQFKNNWIIAHHLLLTCNPLTDDKEKKDNGLDLHLDIINKIDNILKTAPKQKNQPTSTTTRSSHQHHDNSHIEQRQPLRKQIQLSQISFEEILRIDHNTQTQINQPNTSPNSNIRFINSLDEISLDTNDIKSQHIEIIDIPSKMKNTKNNLSSLEQTSDSQTDPNLITRKIEFIDLTKKKTPQPQHKSIQTKLIKPPTPPNTVDITKIIDTINSQISISQQNHSPKNHNQKTSLDINETQALIKIGHRNQKNHNHSKEPPSNEQSKETNQLYYMQTLTKNYSKNDKDIDNLQKELEHIQTEFKQKQKQIKEQERQAREHAKHKKKQQQEKLRQQKHLERKKKIDTRKKEKEREQKIREKLLHQKQKEREQLLKQKETEQQKHQKQKEQEHIARKLEAEQLKQQKLEEHHKLKLQKQLKHKKLLKQKQKEREQLLKQKETEQRELNKQKEQRRLAKELETKQLKQQNIKNQPKAQKPLTIPKIKLRRHQPEQPPTPSTQEKKEIKAQPETPIKQTPQDTKSQLHDEEIIHVLEMLDKLLIELPEQVIQDFAKSKDFALYEKVMNRYKQK